GYMSPEQARGSAADHRSDIFSCGLILHEMMCGNSAFQRDSAVETLNAILKEKAPPLPGETPAVLRRIVVRCLEKQPQHRFQSAADLAFALEFSDTPAEPRAGAKPPSRRNLVIAGGALAATAAGALLIGKRLDRPAHPIFNQLTFRRGSVFGARF